MLKPLTHEQIRMSEKNHNIVYDFLRKNNLAYSDYYDIIIFGFLSGIQDYCENSRLHRYALSTIVWKRMNRAAYNHKKYSACRKRHMSAISISDITEYRRIHNMPYMQNEAVLNFEMNLLLDLLALKLPHRQMHIIRMLLNGSNMRDIAKSEHMTFHDIKKLLTDIHGKIEKICYENEI